VPPRPPTPPAAPAPQSCGQLATLSPESQVPLPQTVAWPKCTGSRMTELHARADSVAPRHKTAARAPRFDRRCCCGAIGFTRGAGMGQARGWPRCAGGWWTSPPRFESLRVLVVAGRRAGGSGFCSDPAHRPLPAPDDSPTHSRTLPMGPRKTQSGRERASHVSRQRVAPWLRWLSARSAPAAVRAGELADQHRRLGLAELGHLDLAGRALHQGHEVLAAESPTP
jgi:hypothetical protein